MPQRITEMAGAEFAPYATQALGMASEQRGLGGMVPPNQGLTNQDDTGAYSKSFVNAQGQRQMELEMQNVRQNTMTAAPQAAANAMGQVRKQTTEMSSAASNEQQFMNSYMADVLEQQGGGQHLMALNSRMTGPEQDQFVNNIAVSRQTVRREAPELGQIQTEANRYMGLIYYN